MKHLRPRVSEDAARRHFRGRFQPLRRLWTRRSRSEGTRPRLPKLERLWMPYYLLRVAPRVNEGPPLTVSVSGYAGIFAIFQLDEFLVDGPPPEEAFSPALSPEAAERVARRELVGTLIRLRGNRKRFEPGDTIGIELIHYPYWIYYFERRRGRLDMRLLDALTGEKPGHRLKLAMLEALVAAAPAPSEETALEPERM